ncbi:MAG: Aminomethyltransferase [Myxococcota bacterium]|nr:Aminomethyltransferase [Myxococcota bacterium]
MSLDSVRKTPLYDAHAALGGRLVEFAGWALPVQYEGVIAEHKAVRERAGLFDVSHMGEVEVKGPQALDALNRVITNDLNRIVDGQALYTCMCLPNGGIVDDLVVYRFSREHFFICVNASNRDKDFKHIAGNLGPGAQAVDRGDDYAQLALQGPRAAEILQPLTDTPLKPIGSYHFAAGKVADRNAIISRTGYTGEDGFELYIAPGDAEAVWNALLESGKPHGLAPCGLGCRDSLRLEMKYALYGNDIDESTNPLEAGLGWVVKFNKGDFIGRSALQAIKSAGIPRRLAGFEVTGRGIARHGYAIRSAHGTGVVTSGTHSPSLNIPIGMGYVPAADASPGTALWIDVRGKEVEARVADTPFLKRKPA